MALQLKFGAKVVKKVEKETGYKIAEIFADPSIMSSITVLEAFIRFGSTPELTEDQSLEIVDSYMVQGGDGFKNLIKEVYQGFDNFFTKPQTTEAK